jgi:hypothetical protein
MSAGNGTSLPLEDRRKAVLSVMDDAADSAGIPRELLGGIWKIESTYGENLTSGTGCEGDFQFLASTFAGEIKDNGSRIAARLRARGQDDLASTVENYSAGLKNGSISKRNADLQALRDDPLVSAYAAAYLAAETARSVHADPMNRNDWGSIYAGYNIGPQGARQLGAELADTWNAKAQLGIAAKANPYFFVNNATGAQALRNYQKSIAAAADNFSARFARGGGVPSPVTTPIQRTAASVPVSATRAHSGAPTDNFNDIVGKYMRDGNVTKLNGTIVKYGICQSANPDVDVAHLTRDDALQLYKTRYWNGIKGIDNMSREDAAAAFDVSYRHGPAYANRVVQRMHGAQSEPLSTSFRRNTDPARTTAAARNAPQVKENSLSGPFLASAAHYVRDLLKPLAGVGPMPLPALA